MKLPTSTVVAFETCSPAALVSVKVTALLPAMTGTVAPKMLEWSWVATPRAPLAAFRQVTSASCGSSTSAVIRTNGLDVENDAGTSSESIGDAGGETITSSIPQSEMLPVPSDASSRA